MHSCWKTVNITREFGSGRIYISSCLFGVFAFILLFLPYSLLHQNNAIVDHGFLPVLLMLIVLPMVHNLTHVIPLILFNKKVKIRWRFELGFIPTFSFQPKKSLSKTGSILVWLAPTILLTIPGLIGGSVLPNYYPYVILFIAINIGMSFKDFIYVKHFLKAPKKCLIEKAKEGFDILVLK
jgi:hypothetical protein